MSSDAPIRTIRVPIARVLGPGDKHGFYSDLRKSLDVSTAAANYCLTALAARDMEGTKFRCGLGELAKPDKELLYTYPLVKDAFPMAANAAASLTRDVSGLYAKQRYQIMIGQRSLPLYRTYPWPMPHSTLQLEATGGGDIQLSLQLIGGRWLVSPRQGSNYRWAAQLLRKCCDESSGVELRGSEISLQTRHGKQAAVLYLAVAVPPRERELSGTMQVASGRDYLLTITKPHSSHPWVITGDAILQRKQAADRRRRRIWADTKVGTSRSVARRLSHQIASKTQKQMKDFCHQASAALVRKALMLRVADVRLDTTVRSYCPSFPWHELEQLVKAKCTREGIKCEIVKRPVTDPEGIDKQPLVYFAMEITADGQPMGYCKIGRTTDWAKRVPDLINAVSVDMVLLAADATSTSNLGKREKHWHAFFASHRLSSKEETFQLNPVLNYLRETGCLGNCGNLSQIEQYVDV